MGHASGKSLSISLYCMVLVGIALYHCWLWWMGCISQDTYLLIVWYCMVLHGIELQHTEFHVISLYSIVLHGIAWLCFVLHGIVCLTMCSVTYSWYVKLWGLPRRVFTLFEYIQICVCVIFLTWVYSFMSKSTRMSHSGLDWLVFKENPFFHLFYWHRATPALRKKTKSVPKCCPLKPPALKAPSNDTGKESAV